MRHYFCIPLIPFMLCATALSLVSCRDTTISDAGDKVNKSESLVQNWYKAESIKNVSYGADLNIFELMFNVTEADKAIFQSKYDDHHFNKATLPGTYTVLVNEFDGISIKSDQVFNEVPAGCDLADKFWLIAESPYKWLKSGSLVTYDWDGALPAAPIDESLIRSFFNHKEPWYYPVIKRISKLDKEDFLLFDNTCIALLADETPEIKEHNLVISFKEGNSAIKIESHVVFN